MKAAIVGIALCVTLLAACVYAQYSPNQIDEDNEHWAALSGGIANRPYISDFSVTTGGVTTVLWSGLTAASQFPPSSLTGTTGKLTALISAFNMCRVNQTTMCYASPNRIGVSLGVTNNYNMAFDFTQIASTDHTITADSVFDVTVKQNAFKTNSAWTWANGDLQYYSVVDGTMRLKIKPTVTPLITWPDYPNNGCTATPIRDCNVTRSSANMLNANWVWSVDQTLTTFTGAAFATTGAIAGFLVPVFERGQYNPTLNYQLSGAHYTVDGSLTKGTLRAILPLAKVQALYPEFDGQDPASYFNVTRSGDSGSQDSITFSTWNATTHGTTGVLFEVTGVTFSAPTYKMSHNSGTMIVPSLFITLVCAVLALVFRQ